MVRRIREVVVLMAAPSIAACSLLLSDGFTSPDEEPVDASGADEERRASMTSAAASRR
jgi:hypothetical protein